MVSLGPAERHLFLRRQVEPIVPRETGMVEVCNEKFVRKMTDPDDFMMIYNDLIMNYRIK